MTSAFREACKTTSARAGGLSVHDVIPKHSHTQRAADHLGAREMEDRSNRGTISMDAVAARLLSLLQADATLSTTELRDAIWCLWTTQPALAARPDAFEKIVKQIEQSDKRKPFRTLATLYLIQFQADRPCLDRIGSVLQRDSFRWGEPFATHQREYALYDPVVGPRNIATLALKRNVSPTEAMRSLGFAALDAQSGFTEAITRNLLVALGNGAEADHLKRLEKVRSYALDNRNELLFRGLDLEIAEALMKPFLGKSPEKAIKDIFLNFIVSIFRDPRTYPGRWERFPQIKAMVISWLTEQSLRQFLDIVGRTIKNPRDAEMWRYRRAFWEAAYNKGIIKGAWVAFGEQGAHLARKSFGNKADFGVLEADGTKQIQPTHAVLLLEVARGIVADWSHVGKVNVWSDASEPGAPKLYQKRYTAGDVTISKDDLSTDRYLVKTHHSPNTYSWQRSVADRIYRMTNTRLQETDYAV